MFIAALFAVARTGKQPKCSTTGDWLKKPWHIRTMGYYSAMRRDEILPLAIWMDLEVLMLREMSQTEKAESHTVSHTCV